MWIDESELRIGFIVYLRNKYDTDALTVLIEVITLVLQIC